MKISKIVFLIIITFILIFNACQNPNEPVLNVEGVNVSLKFETFEGTPISGIQVQYTKGNTFVQNESVSFGSGYTNNNGIVDQIMSIPIEGEINAFKFSTTANLGIPSEYLNKIYTFNIACKDSTYTIKLPMTIQANCNQTLDPINPKKLLVCPKVKVIDTLIIGPICLDCDDPVNISYNLPAKIKNSKLIITDLQNNILSQNPFTMSSKSCFYVYFVYDSKGEIIQLESDVVSFNVNNGSINYKLVDLNLSAESICSVCDCPMNSTIIYPTDSTSIDICLGEEKDFSISLSKFVNQNTKCELKFILEKDFKNNDVIEFISFNNDNFKLSPNSTLGSLRVKVKGITAKQISDEIKFKVQSYNPEYNITEDCNTSLTVKLNINISDGKCEYDLNSSIFNSQFKSIDSTVIMKAGIGTIDTNSIGIKNPSNCPLIITKFELDDISKQGRPFEILDKDGNLINFPLIIPKISTYYFIIRFKPDVIDAYPPDGIRKDVMQDKFETKLRFITTSQNCELADIKLKGEIVSKSANWTCMLEAKGGFKQGISFRNDGALLVDTSDYFIYLDSYNNSTGKAKIKRTITSGNLVYVSMAKSSNKVPADFTISDICEIATNNNSACDLAFNSNLDEIEVSVGDIVAFNYFYTDSETQEQLTYCTIMVVDEISLSSHGGVYKICFTTCTGI